MKRLALGLVSLALCVEGLARLWAAVDPSWYREAAADLRDERPAYLFVGSSRVASAIDVVAFGRALADGGPVAELRNLGMGYSLLAQHYFGLRRVAQARPSGLKGVTVFLEAPEGMPDLMAWSEPWFHPNSPELLVDTIALEDLPSFWTAAGGNFGQKTSVSASVLSEAVARRGTGRRLAASVRRVLAGHAQATSGEAAQLVEAGGVQTDAVAIANARSHAKVFVAEQLARERVLTNADLERSVLKRLIELVRMQGGRLILFHMPMSSLQRVYLQTDVAKHNRAVAGAWLVRQGVYLLDPNIQVSDADFPDAWHLRRTRASEFSERLARVFTGVQGSAPR